jgi:hypothetical protein
MVYGIFILLLMAIPNAFSGRAAFLFCGGMMTGVGVILYLISRKIEKRIEAHPELVATSPDASMPAPLPGEDD